MTSATCSSTSAAIYPSGSRRASARSSPRPRCLRGCGWPAARRHTCSSRAASCIGATAKARATAGRDTLGRERWNMSSRIALSVLVSLMTATGLAADTAKAKQLMTLMRADEVVAGAMKTGLRNNKTGIGLTDAQLACLNAVPHSEFSDVVTKALAEGLTNEEIAAAITFYRTPAGTNYVKSI